MAVQQHQPVISIATPDVVSQYGLVVKKMLSAGAAASVAEMATIPIDTSKVRLQIQGEGAAMAAGQQLKYRGMIQTMLTIGREEGVKSLYRGLSAGLQRQLCFSGIRVGLYDSVRKMYGDDGEGKPKVLVKILASITTASTAVILFQPTEVVKIRFQAAGKSNIYKGTFDAYRTIARKEGLLNGLWRGVGTNVARLSVCNCTEIVVYDIIKSYILYKNLMNDNMPCHFASAFSAGFITSVVASPIDVVKTRYMNAKNGQYKNPLHCAVSVMKKNGPTAFYKGFIPAFYRIALWNVVFFVSFEQIKKVTKANM